MSSVITSRVLSSLNIYVKNQSTANELLDGEDICFLELDENNEERVVYGEGTSQISSTRKNLTLLNIRTGVLNFV